MQQQRFEKPCVALIQDSQHEIVGRNSHHQESNLVCELDSGEVYNVDAPDHWLQEQVQNRKILSGLSKIKMPKHSFVDEENFEIKMVEMPSIISPLIGEEAPGRRNLGTLEGSLSVLVVRVVASNAYTSASEQQLANSIFGNDSQNPQVINMRSQYAACSHSKLQFIEAADRNGKSSRIRRGATTVQVDVSTTQGDRVMRNAITLKLNDEFGVSRPDELADHVMYCLPPNTLSGVAYAYIDSWNSVFNNDWCLKLSAQMHEIGHNLNLGHSNEIDPYDDKSGMVRVACLMFYISDAVITKILTDTFILSCRWAILTLKKVAP